MNHTDSDEQQQLRAALEEYRSAFLSDEIDVHSKGMDGEQCCMWQCSEVCCDMRRHSLMRAHG
jgi:hypothetical protein